MNRLMRAVNLLFFWMLLGEMLGLAVGLAVGGVRIIRNASE